MKTYRGSGGMAPRFLDLGTRWRWVVNFTLRPLYSWEETPIPIGQKAVWAPEPVWTQQWRRQKKKKIPFLPVSGIEPWSVVQPIPQSLHWSIPGSQNSIHIYENWKWVQIVQEGFVVRATSAMAPPHCGKYLRLRRWTGHQGLTPFVCLALPTRTINVKHFLL
jgi:hypothetical protein